MPHRAIHKKMIAQKTGLWGLHFRCHWIKHGNQFLHYERGKVIGSVVVIHKVMPDLEFKALISTTNPSNSAKKWFLNASNQVAWPTSIISEAFMLAILATPVDGAH